ncbi:MAG: DUF4241 domain-containing protein [Defluviitaleaceae bacterium]|nr:DUF4241 domain-containing protein [Defluviitaleaceae bacterium]
MYKNDDLLNQAYNTNVTITSEILGMEVTLTKKEIGNIYLETGHVVAIDPFVCYKPEAFLTTVPPGAYPVSISVANFKDSFGTADNRVALAMLKFSDKKPVRWEMATTSEKQQAGLADLKPDGYYGYGVDTGTGCFMDKSVADKIDADHETNYYEKFEDEFEANYVNTYSYMLTSAFGNENKDYACFSSGFGDGSYPSYFGFAEDGTPCALVTDFCLI